MSISKRDCARENSVLPYRRWKMNSFDIDAAPQASSAEGTAASAAELQRLRESAEAEGHAAGKARGYEAGHEEGLREGREQGAAHGYADGFAKASTDAARLGEYLESMRHALDAVQEEVSDTLVALALEIAQQVVRAHVAHDARSIVAVVREVLAAEPALTGAPTLLVSPADMPIVDAHLRDEIEARGWSVQTDTSIQQGGCRARASSGEIDASIGTRWERVIAAIGKVSPW